MIKSGKLENQQATQGFVLVFFIKTSRFFPVAFFQNSLNGFLNFLKLFTDHRTFVPMTENEIGV